MLNQLFDSVCVTSGYYDGKLYLCCPPRIRVYDDNFEFQEEHNVNALYIIKQPNDLIAVSDQSITYLDDRFNTISTYQRQQRWNKITAYDDFLILEYKSEYQIIRRNDSQEQLKQKIIGFTNNPHNQLTYIQKTQNLRNNELVCGNKKVSIEIAVDQVFLISQKQTHYIYQSKLFPVVTVVDLKHQVELYCLDFQPTLDSVFVLNDLVLLQSINSIYQLKNQQLQDHNVRIKLSCLIQIGNKIMYGSSHDNPIVQQDSQLVHLFQNVGHIIDIHPCQQICYIASCYKRYPISVFRKGINDKLLGKLKLDGRRPINIFMIDEYHALLQYIDYSQVYLLPYFQKIDIGLITSQITISIAQVAQYICQITRNGIFLIFNNKIIKDVQNLNVRDAKIQQNLLSIYERDNLLKLYIISNEQIILQSVHEMKDISAFSLVNLQLYFSKWFDKNLYTLKDAIYYGDIQTTIVSIQSQEQLIYLGENEGQLIIINQSDHTIWRKFQIANSHPIRMSKYQDKILILSNQNYLLGDKLNIVNWEQVYQVSTYGDKLVGILCDQVQYITLNDAPGSQWQEIRAFEWYDVLGLRYFKDKLNVLVHDKNYKIEAYQSNKFLRSMNLDFLPFKLEVGEHICIVGNSDKFGYILVLDDYYNVIIKQQLNEFVYALKYENNQIYYSTETAIHLLGVGMIYDFKIQIEFFEIKDNYYLICDSFKGTHLFLHDDRMICLGVILGPSNFATFYFSENIIAFTKQKLIIAKPNSLFLGVTEQMETVTSINLYVTALKDQYYGTFWGQLGYFE